MQIEIDTLEILVLIFGYFTSKWIFRFLIMALIAKTLNSLKEKGSSSLKEFQEKMKQGES